MIKIVCDREQALILAWLDYRRYQLSESNIWEKKCELCLEDIYVKEGDKFVIYIDHPFLENLPKFVQKSKAYKDFFKTEIVLEEVAGFNSPQEAFDAIDKFNSLQPSDYIDPYFDVTIEEIECIHGSLFVPLIHDKDLERSFWRFAKCNSAISRNIKSGKEKCQKKR